LENGFENEVASKDYKVEGIPNIIIFDKEGKLVY
jgi:thioredoxin-related protein